MYTKTSEFFQTPSSVCIRLCKHSKCFMFLLYTTKVVPQKQQLYVIAYLVDFAVAPSSTVGPVPLPLKFQTVVSLLEASWLSCKLRSRYKLGTSSSSNIFKVEGFVHVYVSYMLAVFTYSLI